MAFGHASPEAVIAAKIVFTIAAGLLTLARLYTRKRIVNNAGLDDLLIAFGLASMAVSIDLQLADSAGRSLLWCSQQVHGCKVSETILWIRSFLNIILDAWEQYSQSLVTDSKHQSIMAWEDTFLHWIPKMLRTHSYGSGSPSSSTILHSHA